MGACCTSLPYSNQRTGSTLAPNSWLRRSECRRPCRSQHSWQCHHCRLPHQPPRLHCNSSWCGHCQGQVSGWVAAGCCHGWAGEWHTGVDLPQLLAAWMPLGAAHACLQGVGSSCCPAVPAWPARLPACLHVTYSPGSHQQPPLGPCCSFNVTDPASPAVPASLPALVCAGNPPGSLTPIKIVAASPAIAQGVRCARCTPAV